LILARNARGLFTDDLTPVKAAQQIIANLLDQKRTDLDHSWAFGVMALFRALLIVEGFHCRFDVQTDAGIAQVLSAFAIYRCEIQVFIAHSLKR
jgi:hypothetical protein